MLQNFRVACDSANVIRSLQGIGMMQYGHIVQKFGAIKAYFSGVEFVHEGKRPNDHADNLAKSNQPNRPFVSGCWSVTLIIQNINKGGAY